MGDENKQQILKEKLTDFKTHIKGVDITKLKTNDDTLRMFGWIGNPKVTETVYDRLKNKFDNHVIHINEAIDYHLKDFYDSNPGIDGTMGAFDNIFGLEYSKLYNMKDVYTKGVVDKIMEYYNSLKNDSENGGAKRSRSRSRKTRRVRKSKRKGARKSRKH